MPETHQGAVSPVLIVLGVIILVAGGLLFSRPEAHAAPIVLWGEAAATSAVASGAKPNAAPAATATPAPPIKARVGLQVGHWESENLPAELAVLRTEHGATAGGFKEVDINYAIAQRVADLLRARGITVDIFPATIPSSYTADAFIAIHSDYNNSAAMNGFKLARFRDSAIPVRDDALLGAITTDYGAATGQPRDTYITRDMLGYYAFNSADYQHAISPKTPGVIIELGFLTNPNDLTLLTEQQATVATGLAAGIIRFLTGA